MRYNIIDINMFIVRINGLLTIKERLLNDEEVVLGNLEKSKTFRILRARIILLSRDIDII